MNLIDLIVAGKLDEAKQCCCDRLKEITAKRLEEAKRYVVADMFEEIEEQELKTLEKGHIYCD
jgi:hypothetical protein